MEHYLQSLFKNGLLNCNRSTYIVGVTDFNVINYKNEDYKNNWFKKMRKNILDLVVSIESRSLLYPWCSKN